MRSLVMFACSLVICSVFSLQPSSVHDTRRMILLSITTLILTVACMDRRPSPVRWNISAVLSLELFAISILVTLPMHPVGAGYSVFSIDILFLFPMFYAAVINRDSVSSLIDTIADSAILMGVICFAYSVILIRRGDEEVEAVGRMAGAISNPNYYGMAGLAMLIAGIYLMQRMYSNIAVVITMALAAGTGLSMMIKAISRTAIISSFFCFVLLLIYLSKANRKQREHARKRNTAVLLFLMIAALAAAGGIWLQKGSDEAKKTSENMRFLASEAASSVCYTAYAEDGNGDDDNKTFWERFDFTGEDADSYTSGRTAIWRTYASYLNLMGNDYDTMLENRQIPMRAHNNIIDYAFRFGIPAGILYLIFYIAVIVKAAILLFGRKSLKPEDLWILMVVTSYALYSMVEISSLPFTRYIPCLFFLSIGPLMGAPASWEHEEFAVADGVSEISMHLTDTDGNNVKVHIVKIQKDSGARVIAACSEGLISGEPANQSSLSSIVKNYEEMHKGSDAASAAFSGDFFSLKNGKPRGALVMNGQLMNDPGRRPFLAVMNDGSLAIRKASAGIDDVAEAVGGRPTILRSGKIKVGKEGDRHPRQAAGVCKDGSLIIMNVEGRQPDSRGVRLYDLALFLKEAGCVDAINLDGGGSAGFMTKRPGDSEPVFRNVPGDGYERNISSAIMVTENLHSEKNTNASERKRISGPDVVWFPDRICDRDTYLDKTIFGTYKYTRKGTKPSGVFNIDGNAYLFKEGRGITDTIRIGETEYEFRKGAYIGSTDTDAGDVVFGYCGADDDGKNLMFALHKGDWLLNIGPNPIADLLNADGDGAVSGEMEDWDTTQESLLPWYAFRHRIRNVYIADGVTSIGSRFLYMPDGKVKVSTETPLNELSQVRLPYSLRSVGDYAFYNKPLLKKVILPSGNIRFGREAFDMATILTIKH